MMGSKKNTPDLQTQCSNDEFEKNMLMFGGLWGLGFRVFYGLDLLGFRA